MVRADTTRHTDEGGEVKDDAVCRAGVSGSVKAGVVFAALIATLALSAIALLLFTTSGPRHRSDGASVATGTAAGGALSPTPTSVIVADTEPVGAIEKLVATKSSQGPAGRSGVKMADLRPFFGTWQGWYYGVSLRLRLSMDEGLFTLKTTAAQEGAGATRTTILRDFTVVDGVLSVGGVSFEVLNDGALLRLYDNSAPASIDFARAD